VIPRLFLSYAREDGELPAAEIRKRLSREAPDIVIQQDRLFCTAASAGGSRSRTRSIRCSFSSSSFTPAALKSRNVEKEWRYARQQGVCIYPVKGAPDSQLRFAEMPRWMSKAHFFDLKKEWPPFVAHLCSGCHATCAPFMAPALPAYFIKRPTEYEVLKNLLLSPDRAQPVTVTTALAGAGGFGKTTLAAALCHDEDILENFDDGMLWVSLGQTPALLGALLTAYAARTGDRPAFADAEVAAFQFGQKLEQRTCLLVNRRCLGCRAPAPVSSWRKSAARDFTTRNANIAAQAAAVNVDEMRRDEAMTILAKGVPGLEAGPAADLARRLGEWPLALELAAAMIRERARQGYSPAHAAGWHRIISGVLEVSLQLLDTADRKRLVELSVFPEGVAIPLAAAALVWERDDLDAEDLAQCLARLSFLKLDLQRGVLGMHNVMRNWLAGTLASPCDIHNRLVKGWPDFRRLAGIAGRIRVALVALAFAAGGAEAALRESSGIHGGSQPS
jgi:hypothetical protein